MIEFKKVTKTFECGGQTVTLETGHVARQATGAVMVTMEGTVVLVTVVGKEGNDQDRGFFPLTVNYTEKTYAAGKIPGGFFKREGRPSERETLISRLIDRPLRPLFPEGFRQEVQVIATVVSLNPEVSPAIPSIIGASAALAISGIPFSGPVAAARVGYKDGNYLLNPSIKQLEDSDLELVVAGTEKAVIMVESEANVLSEEIMLGAVTYGHEQMQVAISAIKDFAKQAAKPAWDWKAQPVNETLAAKVAGISKQALNDAYNISDKLQRQIKVAEAKQALLDQLFPENVEAHEFAEDEVKATFSKLEKTIVRQRILENQPRIDGRDTKTVRPIDIQVGVLPRTHGSAIFTRGETQALVVATLGSTRDAQTIDALEGEYKETFLLHYNFPPFCVGETGMVGSPKRREIGHGKLAYRAIQAVLPDEKEYPYVTRVVSEITESNGSSSMATVCGTSLALMDAGVPTKAPVAGIAMGLVKESDKHVVLTDILGDEDHLGDMDFKVAGTAEGITALQMDIKIEGITREIMQQALQQAKEGRLHILGEMDKSINKPRVEMSDYAPRIISVQIHPDKIRDVIGKGGVTIRSITEETGATIDINDEGLVQIAAVNREAGEEAKKRIELITAEAEVGKVYEGKVTKITDFGAFVNILPGKDGLVHISQICDERVEKVTDKLSEGQIVKVVVLEIDRMGRVRLSMKAVKEQTA